MEEKVMAVDSVSQRQEYVRQSSDDKEETLVAQHRREIAELQKRHQEQIDKLRTSYSDQLSELRSKTREVMTEKDEQHRKDIQEMQDVNRKRLTKVKMDDEEQRHEMKKNLEGELERSKTKNQTDNNRLVKIMNTELSQKDESTREMAEKAREGSQEAIKTQGKLYKERFDEERNNYRGQIVEGMKEKQREVGALRTTAQHNENELNAKLDSQKKTSEDRFTTTVLGDRAHYQESLDRMQEGYQEQRAEDREKLAEKSGGLNSDSEEGFAKLRETVNERVENEIRSVQRENSDLKNSMSTNKSLASRKTETEKRNLAAAYQKNIDELEKRRLEATKLAHEEYGKKIDKIQDTNDKFIANVNIASTRKLEEQKFDSDKHFSDQIGYVERDRDLNKMQTDKQKKRLVDIYAERTVNQADFYEDQMDAKKKTAEQMLLDQRTSLERKHFEDVGALRGQMVKEGTAHQEKLVETVSKYENQISALRNEYEKKLKHQGDVAREEIGKQFKHQQMDREAFESKMQQRISQVKETYEREIDQLRKRQSVERQELAMKQGLATKNT
jgi:hypothetical protein